MKTLIHKQLLFYRFLPTSTYKINFKSTFRTERKNHLTDNEDNLMEWKQLDKQNIETHI